MSKFEEIALQEHDTCIWFWILGVWYYVSPGLQQLILSQETVMQTQTFSKMTDDTLRDSDSHKQTTFACAHTHTDTNHPNIIFCGDEE